MDTPHCSIYLTVCTLSGPEMVKDSTASYPTGFSDYQHISDCGNSINRKNLTHQFIKESGQFTISVLGRGDSHETPK